MDELLQRNIIKKHEGGAKRRYCKRDVAELLGTLGEDWLTGTNVSTISRRAPKLAKLLENVIAANSTQSRYRSTKYGIGRKEGEELRRLVSLSREGLSQLESRLSSGRQVYHLARSGNTLAPVQVGGFISEEGASVGTQALDLVQLLMDVAGFAPGVGIAPDVVSMLMSLVRGSYYDALCSAISVIPLVGSFVGTPMKYVRKYKRVARVARRQYQA